MTILEPPLRSGSRFPSIPLLVGMLFLFGSRDLDAVPAQQQPSDGGAIAGTVVEAGSRQPIHGAIIRVPGADRTATTNASGRFRIERLAAGRYELSVTALGYQDLTGDPYEIGSGDVIRVTIGLESRPVALERLVITATKTIRSSEEVAALTSVVEREDIEERGDPELVDAIENATGVLRSAQAGSFESIELRGMPREGNEFESTLLLIDGVPQTDSRNSARVINLPIENADAIEIVRGPNSALYGRTAIGGAINVLTARPTPESRVRGELQIGEFGHLRAAVNASGPIRDRAGYFVSWSSMGTDGFYSKDPSYDVDENSVFAKITLAPDEDSEAMVSIDNVTSDNSLPTSVPVIGGDPLSELEPRFDIFDNINLPTANYHQEELRLTASYTRDFGERISFTNTLGYRDIQYKFEESGDIIGAPFDLGAGTLTMYPFSLQSDEEILYEEARVSFRPGPAQLNQELLVGASYESNTGFRQGDLIYTDAATFGMPMDFLEPTPPPRSDWQFFPFGGDDYSLETLGLFFRYEIAPVPRLRLTAGGRFDRLDLENVETFQTGQPRMEETFDAFSPKATILFRLVEERETGFFGRVGLNVYATYSESFKPPRSPSGLNPPDTQSQPPSLEPEDITNYEVGLKSTFLDDRGSFRATYFQMERHGIVVSTREGPFFRESNAGRQDFEGLEVAVTWTATPEVRLHGNAAFYHNRFGPFVIQREGVEDVVLTKNRLPLVPDRIFNVGGTWRPTAEWGATVGLKHVGDRYVDQNNTLLLDSYPLLDGSVFWSPGPVTLTLSGRNLLDEHYFTIGDTSNAESVAPGAPRQLILTSSFAFG